MTLADGETAEEAVGSIRGGSFGRHFGDTRCVIAVDERRFVTSESRTLCWIAVGNYCCRDVSRPLDVPDGGW
jgi:hypothetical protein